MNTMNRQARLAEIQAIIDQGPFTDSWDSLSAYRVPQWYKAAKFGIFIHWGVYSVPAFGSEWYPRNMYIQGSREYEHHIQTYGPHKEFGYKDFVPLFKAERYDASEWAELFLRAGARYVVPVAEHHDGFQMYPSTLSEWNAAEKGPCRDVLGQLQSAAQARGIAFGVSSHRVEHWFFLGHGKDFDSDVRQPLEPGDLYWPAEKEPESHQDLYSTPAPTTAFLEDWLLRCCELVDNYRPKIFYFDWWIQHNAVKPYLKKFAAYYYNRAHAWGEEVAINYKHDAFLFGCAVPDIERGQFANVQPFFWQTDTAIARNSWSYTANNEYKSARSIVCDLVDIVSKNGTMLLNVGPRADGTIGAEDAQVLRQIGAWLSTNGEAIYETDIWRSPGEGPTQIEEGQFTDGKEKVFTSGDIRFTRKGSCLYATVLAYPQDGRITIRSLADANTSRLPVFSGIIRSVQVLGFAETPAYTRDASGLHIQTQDVASDMPVVFRITLD